MPVDLEPELAEKLLDLTELFLCFLANPFILLCFAFAIVPF